MSKARDIRVDVATRLAALGTVKRGSPDQFDNAVFNELPVLFVYTPQVENEEEQSRRYKVASETVIQYHKKLERDTEPDDQGDAMVESVRAAIEIEPRRLADNMVLPPGITWLRYAIELPPDAGSVVSVSVTYNTPHIDTFG